MPVYNDGTVFFFLWVRNFGSRIEGVEDKWLEGVWFCGGMCDNTGEIRSEELQCVMFQ